MQTRHQKSTFHEIFDEKHNQLTYSCWGGGFVSEHHRRSGSHFRPTVCEDPQ